MPLMPLARPRFAVRVAAAMLAVVAAAPAAAGPLAVTSTTPAPNALDVAPQAAIAITFDRPVDPATVTADSVRAFGRWSGAVAGSRTLSGGGAVLTLVPDRAFTAGETVMVILSHDLRGTDGTPLRTAGHSFQFWTRALAGPMTFTEIDVMTTRTFPSQTSRAYGGIGTDLDGDGFCDITVVNEDTADLRVFLNRADGTGLHDPFLQPPSPVGNRASPSEPADFDNDGNADVCVANINDDTVSVLLGNGDGTFAPQQVIAVGNAPRGIAVLDVDGDGDVDIVNTNASGSSLTLMLNDGAGVFGPPTTFEGGGSGEWALAAAEMNGDGILDLVIGARTSELIIILLGNGDGTFTFSSSTPSGGATWMLMCGDVDGDGFNDVAAVNSSDNNGSILLGDGDGPLGAAATYAVDSFPLATDLGDMDGDGDLDWITSSFGGDWRFLSNDGDGTYSFVREFDAPSAASCSLPLDIDNDGDLDLALIDEIADVVILMRQDGIPCPADLDGSGSVGFTDVLAVLASWGPCGPPCPEDLDGSGAVGFTDLLAVLAAWGECD